MKLITIPVTAFQQNCCLLICEKTNKAAVVDPGGDIPVIKQHIAQQGCTVEQILLTHAHIDHAGATAELAADLGVDIIGPEKGDQFWIDMLPQQSQMFNFPASSIFQPTRWLEDGDTVNVGETTLDVIHCPGHTPGHVVFFSKDDKLAVVGDVLFNGSIGRTDFPQGDHQTLINSITQKLWPLGNDVTFSPGHGPQSTFGQERQSNPFVGDRAVG